MERTPLPSRVVTGLAALLIFGTIGVTLYHNGALPDGTSVRASALVVHNSIRTSDSGERNFHPVLQFRDGEGVLLTVETERAAVRDGNPAYPAGETVAVLYDPSRPELARIDTLLDRWAMPVLSSPLLAV